MIYNAKHPGSLQTTRVFCGVDQWENHSSKINIRRILQPQNIERAFEFQANFGSYAAKQILCVVTTLKAYICSIAIACNFLKITHNCSEDHGMLYFIMKNEFLCCRKIWPLRGDPGEDRPRKRAHRKAICNRKEERPCICRFKAFLRRSGIFPQISPEKLHKWQERGEKGITV